MGPRITILVLFLSIAGCCENYTFLGDYRAHTATKNSLTVKTDNRDLHLQFFDNATIKVTVGQGTGPDLNLSELEPQAVEVENLKTRLRVTFDQGTVELAKSPLRMIVRRKDGSVVTADDPAFGHGWDGKEIRCWKVLDSDHRFFGLGEKSGDVNKRGQFYTNWNSDIPAYRNDSDPLYCGIPFFSGSVANKAFGIFFANSYRSTFNLGAGNKRLYSFGAEDGPFSYYIFTGPTMKDVISSYTAVSGRMSLPPKWALGYQQCRWSYYPEFEIRDVAKEFRQRRIPADVLYFDIHYMDGYKVFTWHPKRFPRPKQLLADLKKQGYKMVTIIDPGVKVEKGYETYESGLKGDHFLKFLDGELFQGQVWPGWCHFPDFRKPDTRKWWGQGNAALRQTGVSGFWNDMNEPALWGKEMPYVVEGIKGLHNRFALLMARATHEGLLEDDPKLRPFIVTRAGWAGIQKYAAVWTGDNSASYDDLALSIRTNIGLGLSGVPFVGCDIGGFIGTPDQELYTRWMQAAALSPFMRSHTVTDSPDQEPWSFGEETERRCREAIELRYRLMPLLYSELHAARETGLPMYRPLWLEFPEDEMTYQNEFQHQFLIGSQLLAAPVIRAGQRFQKVYLPEGNWYQPGADKFHQGAQTVLVEANLDTLPLFYREGSVIPTRAVQQYVDQTPLTELELTVVPGSTGGCKVVLDDGVSVNAQREILQFTKTGERQLRIKLGNGPKTQQLQTLRFRLPGTSAVPTMNGVTLKRDGQWFVGTAREGSFSW